MDNVGNQNTEAAELPVIAPPVGQAEREGWSSHRGYVYQAWYAVYQWLKLSSSEVLFLEHAEDTARATLGELDLTQLKQTASSISLNTKQARSALLNFRHHVQANQGRNVSFQYITTGSISREQGNYFTDTEPGIFIWDKAKGDIVAAARIHDFLKNHAAEIGPDFSRFLTNSTTEQVQEGLIKPFTWKANYLSLENLRTEVSRCIFEFAGGLSQPLRLADNERETMAAILFTTATTASTTQSLRKLDQMELIDLLDRTFLKKTPLRLHLAEEASLTERGSEIFKILPVIDWAEPSRELENWPQTLSDGHEIQRPEFVEIEKRILESEKSACLILGEPGAGKSALLAKLSSSLSARNIRHLSIKADGIPKGLKSLDELVRNLGGLPLLEVIKEVSSKDKFVVLVDQLDGLCSLVDQQTDRLNLLLAFIQQVRAIPQIHVVASCRPFEYEIDTRFLSLKAEKVTLKLPPWETIALLVLDEGGLPAEIPDSLKEVLRVPWQLKLFLDLPHPRPVLTSPYDLLTHIWNEKTTKSEAPDKCADAVEWVASKIKKSEEFWIPEAALGHYLKEKTYLIKEGILKQTDDQRSVGFRHQTFYDYFLLRTFLREDTSLIDSLKSGQSFFVRPTFVRALAYLRQFSRSDYVRTITELLDGDFLRVHLRILLLEFLGSQAAPFPEEQYLILPLLKDSKQGQTVLRVVAGSPGWFRAIIGTDFEEPWMATGWAQAVQTVSFLTAAISFEEATVVDLIARNWLEKPDHDRLAFNILSNAKTWDGRLVECVSRYAERRTLQDMSWLLREFVKTNPSVGSGVYGMLLQKDAAEFVRLDNEAPVTPPANLFAEKGKVPKAISDYLHGKNFIRLGIQKMAEAAPKEFLSRAWPPIREMLILAGVDYPRVDPTCYPRDYVELTNFDNGERVDDLLWAVQMALRALARTDAVSFWAWVANESASNFLSSHRLEARGMIDLDLQQADAVMEYLLADRRRLNLGYVRDEMADTCPLLKKFAGKSSRRFFIKLEKQVMGLANSDLALWKKRRPESTRSEVRRITRLEQYELLSHLPWRRLKSSSRLFLCRQRSRYSGMAARRRQKPVVTSFRGPSISVAAMEAMTDDVITALLAQMSDRIDQERGLDMSEIFRRSEEHLQALEFGQFAAANPKRGLVQVPYLKPGLHETYAAQLVSKLADPRKPNVYGQVKSFPPVLPGAEIEELVRGFDSKEFSTPFFRKVTSYALEHLCSSQAGLDEKTITMLLRWLSEEEIAHPVLETDTQTELPIPKSSILYTEGILHKPSGRTNLVEAIVEGLLTQAPSAVDRCLDFLEGLPRAESETALWADVMLQIAYLGRGHGLRITHLFNVLVNELPRFLTNQSTAFAWSYITGVTNPAATEQTWFDLILAQDIPYLRQIAGELIFLNCARTTNAWSQDLVGRGLRGELGDYFLRGMVYGAAAHLSERNVHGLVEQILTVGLQSANRQIVEAAMTLSNHIHPEGWSESSSNIVMQLVATQLPEGHDLSVLCLQMEKIVAVDPGACLMICERIVQKFPDQLTDPGSSFSAAAGHIINMTLTVQRFEPFRDRGLILFEKLLQLNVTEAKKAADLLNDRTGN